MRTLFGPLHLLFFAEAFAHHLIHRGLHKTCRDRLALVIPLPIIWDQVSVVPDIRAQLRERLDQLIEPGIRLLEQRNPMTPGRRSCQALCRPAHATATTSDVRSSPGFLYPTPHHSASTLCRIDPVPSAASSRETSPKYAWPADSSQAEAPAACRCRRKER